MFQNTDFWIGLGIGVVAGVFGYKLMSEREQQLLACLLYTSDAADD